MAAYKQHHKLLESKGFNIKLNIIDNQASAIIKKYLTMKDCIQMLVEHHNHQVNATECAIQMFKAHFISALTTTDSKFPLQLWDRLTPQVETTLNMLQPSWIDSSKSVYEAMNGPFDWNRFPLMPPGCKAIIYKSPGTRGSWGSRGTDAWCIGPLLDHYRCNHFFIPKT